MAIKSNEETGQIIDDTLAPPDEPPRFAARDHVVRILTNETYRVIQGFWVAQVDGRYGWNYDCQRVYVANDGNSIAPAGGDVEILPEDELQPLPPQHPTTTASVQCKVERRHRSVDLAGHRPDQQDLFRFYALEADLPADRRHVHVLRHSAAAHVLDAGEDIDFARDHLGHRSIQSTMTYAQISDSRRHRTMRRLERSPQFPIPS
jgi:hypothetical protein